MPWPLPLPQLGVQASVIVLGPARTPSPAGARELDTMTRIRTVWPRTVCSGEQAAAGGEQRGAPQETAAEKAGAVVRRRRCADACVAGAAGSLEGAPGC